MKLMVFATGNIYKPIKFESKSTLLAKLSWTALANFGIRYGLYIAFDVEMEIFCRGSLCGFIYIYILPNSFDDVSLMICYKIYFATTRFAYYISKLQLGYVALYLDNSSFQCLPWSNY